MDEEAADFLGWGMHYSKLAHDHVVWTRGVTVGKVDTQQKAISFEYPEDFDLFTLFTQASSEELDMEEFSSNLPYDELQKHFGTWLDKTTARYSDV